MSVIGALIKLDNLEDPVRNADVVLARNLEMLVIAARARRRYAPAARLVYECLDIHRLLLRQDFVGASLRALEGWLSRRASALIISSLAFATGYFLAQSKVLLHMRLVENKILETDVRPISDARPAGSKEPGAGGPSRSDTILLIRTGWVGWYRGLDEAGRQANSVSRRGCG